MLQKDKQAVLREVGATNPILIILVLLMAIFVAVIALFIKQMIARQQPDQVALKTATPETEVVQLMIDPITQLPITNTPTPVVTPTPTPVATSTAAVQPASGTRALNATAAATATDTNTAGATLENQIAPTVASVGNTTVAAANTKTPNTASTVTTNSTKKTSLKGTLTLSGDISANSSILILQKPVNESTYKVISRVAPQRTISWEWPDAVSGKQYNVTYALQVNNENVKTSPVATAIAPATITTRMNTTDNPDARTITSTNASNLGRPWLSSCGSYTNDRFGATIKLPRREGAKNYKLLIGSYENGVDITNIALAANGNDDVTYHMDFENDKPYFVRYAIEMGDGKYSDHSATVEMKCILK